MSELRIDHVVYAVADLDEAAARLHDEQGLASIDGGRHAGHGTANRIVPLGAQYVELIGVVDGAEAASSPVGRAVAAATAAGDRLLGWAVTTDDIEAEARRLSLPVDAMSRTLPGGEELRWSAAGVAAALARPELPFFIEWHDPQRHPGRSAATQGAIAWIQLGTSAATVADWLDGATLPIRTVEGGPPVAAAGVEVGGREFVLR